MSDIVYDPQKRAWCHLPTGSCSPVGVLGGAPNLPTYATVADVLEKKNGSGIRLLGWTIARAVLIAVPVKVVGRTRWDQALAGGAAASVAISILTLLRIGKAANEIAPELPAAPAAENFNATPAPAAGNYADAIVQQAGQPPTMAGPVMAFRRR